MKTKTSLLLAILAGTSFTAVCPVFAQGTAFTYQGLLTTSNGPVNGTYDLTFALWDSLAGGAQVGNSITNPWPWLVTGGQLTFPLDFGPTFSGAPLWLEIAVRTNGVGAFTTLSPRQALTPTPYAIYAESATGLANGVALGSGVGNSIDPAGAPDSFIGGGSENNILSGNSVIAGGMGNFVQPNAAWCFIGGGQNNQTFSAFSSIGGGGGNSVSTNGNYSTVGGGYKNTAGGLGPFATVAGGDNNTAPGIEATVAGGSFNTANGSEATVAGGSYNTANGADATVGGGTNNFASAVSATVAGGRNNNASAPDTTIAGGLLNTANQVQATVGGGIQNTASGPFATVAGGIGNAASAIDATVSGGSANVAGGEGATVAGGIGNVASGDYSFAAGKGANAVNAGSFVWADGTSGNYYSDLDNQFKIRAYNGVVVDAGGATHIYPPGFRINAGGSAAVGLWVVTTSSDANAVFSNGGTGDIIRGFNADNGGNPVFEVQNNGAVYAQSYNPLSDRNAKEDFAGIDPKDVLQKTLSLSISQWKFKADSEKVQHLGPMAQDFHDAFGLNGADNTHISLTDEGGVALAAIQGLNQKLEEQLKSKENEIQELKARLETLEHLVDTTKGGE